MLRDKIQLDGEPIDLYEVLGLEAGATKVEIKKAYHKAALSSHPDKVPEADRAEAEHRFKTISQAYEILYDENKRAHYDRFGMADFTPGGPGGMDGEVDLEDLLSQMFMGGMGGGGMPGMGGMGGRGPKRRQRGRDVVQEYEVSLEELYKGKTVKLASTRNVLCSNCKGTGGKPQAKPKKCATCSGRGFSQNLRQVGRGLVTQESVPCSICTGTGQTFRDKDRCRKCKGAYVTEEKKVLEIYIPPGSKEGEKIVLEGEADEAPDVDTGNIVMVLEAKPHDIFTRSGANLMAVLKISLVDSLTGFSRVVIKHLDGRGIHLTHPYGKILKPGQILKVKGEGMPYKKSDAKGDLYLQVQIEFPEDGWDPDVLAIRKILPVLKVDEIKAEHVDEVDYDSGANIEEFDAAEGGHSGGVWVDDDDEEDEGDGQPQCAQA